MLSWVMLFQARMGNATEGGVQMREEATVDPIKKRIVVDFSTPIPGRSAWIGFQVIAHAFAAANDCAIHKITKRSSKQYVIDVLIKHRLADSGKDPFVDEWKSNHQKKKEAFQKYLRDKAKELEKEASDEPEPVDPLPDNIDLWRR